MTTKGKNSKLGFNPLLDPKDLEPNLDDMTLIVDPHMKEKASFLSQPGFNDLSNINNMTTAYDTSMNTTN
jgi:hypothetical protein